MSIRIEFLEHGLVLTTAEGFVSREDFWGHVETLVQAAMTRPPLREVFDCRALVETDIRFEEIQAAARRTPVDPARLAQMRVALVVNTPLGFGLARIYQSLAEQRGVAVLITPRYEDALRYVAPDEAPE